MFWKRGWRVQRPRGMFLAGGEHKEAPRVAAVKSRLPGLGTELPRSPELGGARRPARGLPTDQMSTGGEGTSLGAFGNPQQRDWPRELIVGVRVRVTDSARISALKAGRVGLPLVVDGPGPGLGDPCPLCPS